MFNRQKQKKQQRPEPLESLSLTPDGTHCLKKQLHQIQQLTGVTQTDFTLLYETSVIHFLDYMSEPNQLLEADAIEQQLTPIVLALKRRRGYLLPLGADSEVAFREREEWTFAVFSAALLKQCDKASRIALTKALLPKQAYDWLQRNPTLFGLWQRYLQGDTKTVFSSIVEQAPLPDQTEATTVAQIKETENRIERTSTTDSVMEVGMIPAEETMPSDVKQETQQEAQKKIPQETISSNMNTAVELVEPVTKPSRTPKETKEIKELDLAVMKTNSHPVEESPVSTPITEQKAVSMVKTTELTVEQTMPMFEAVTFWRWLKSALVEKQFEANQAHSIVHGVELGLFICIPESVDAFIQAKAEQRGFSAEQAIRQQRAHLIKKIKKHERLIKDPKGSRFHQYYLGAWEARHKMSGVIIGSHELLDDPESISVNQQLTIDLLES